MHEGVARGEDTDKDRPRREVFAGFAESIKKGPVAERVALSQGAIFQIIVPFYSGGT